MTTPRSFPKRQYHSVAVVDGLDTSGLAGQQVMTSLGGIVQQER